MGRVDEAVLQGRAKQNTSKVTVFELGRRNGGVPSRRLGEIIVGLILKFSFHKLLYLILGFPWLPWLPKCCRGLFSGGLLAGALGRARAVFPDCYGSGLVH
jgi:hypothetical protein